MEWVNTLLSALDVVWDYLDLILSAVLGAFLIFFRAISTFFSRTLAPLLAKIKSVKEKGGSGGASTSAKRGMRYGSNPKAALLHAKERKEQMKSYISTWEELTLNKWGPYSLSSRLHEFMYPCIQEKMRQLKVRLREFDTLEDKAQRTLHQFDAERYHLREEIVRERLHMNVELAEALAIQQNLIARPFAKEARAARRSIRRLSTSLALSWLKLYRRELVLIKKYRPKMAALAAEVDFVSREYLDKWMDSFAADIASLKLSDITGNVLHCITLPEHADIRERYMLEDDLSDEAIVAFLKPYDVPILRDKSNISSSSETLFEMYLRIRLYESQEMRQIWGVNTSFLDHLAAPGSLGITHATYMQLSDNKDWWTSKQTQREKKVNVKKHIPFKKRL